MLIDGAIPGDRNAIKKKPPYTCHKFCHNFNVVQSWRQLGRRAVGIAVFGLLSLQVLVPRQFAPSVTASTYCGVSRKTMWL
jgi:hypothetical protein